MIIRLIAGGTGKCFTMTIDRIAVKQNAKEIIRTSKPSLITAGLMSIAFMGFQGMVK